jgi:mono/diheme cytochrome c family protein
MHGSASRLGPLIIGVLLLLAGAARAEAPIRTTMEALHASGGVPRGWKFRMPSGDAEAGRKAFIALECFACHRVEGEPFPRESKTPKRAGPDLTGMGGHHPAEYFAESIVSPNRIIIEGPGYTGSDGLSTMPTYADTMTVRQLVDLVAYLRSLKGDMGAHHAHDMGSKPMQGMGSKPMSGGMEKK